MLSIAMPPFEGMISYVVTLIILQKRGLLLFYLQKVMYSLEI